MILGLAFEHGNSFVMFQMWKYAGILVKLVQSLIANSWDIFSSSRDNSEHVTCLFWVL